MTAIAALFAVATFLVYASTPQGQATMQRANDALVSIASNIRDSISRKKQEKRENTVYKLVDGNKIVYVGRTKNPKQRELAHQRDPIKRNYEFEKIEENMTLQEARAVEQMYMIEYNTKNYLNKLNGISPKNPKLNIYTEAGNFYLIMERMICQMKLYIGQDNRKEREEWEHGDQSYFKMI